MTSAADLLWCGHVEKIQYGTARAIVPRPIYTPASTSGSPALRARAILSAMDPTVTALERAFALAKSGECSSVPGIKKRLTREGYSAAAITGPTLLKQLLALIREARGRDQG